MAVVKDAPREVAIRDGLAELYRLEDTDRVS